MNFNEEKVILRELAKQYSEIAAGERQKEIASRMRKSNGLRQVRPIVLIDEIPWHEMDIDSKLVNQCESERAAEMETFFRRALFQAEYFPCDKFYEFAYPVYKTIRYSDPGLSIIEKRLATDVKNNIVSHEYTDRLKTDEDIERLMMQTVIADPGEDEKRKAWASEVLDGILPVVLRGILPYYAPWDDISMLRGVTPILYDMADRPEFLHKIIKRFTDNQRGILDQYEELGLLDADTPLIHCTPAFTDEPHVMDYKSGGYKLGDVWFRSMAQIFSSVSPEMHEEFDLNYSKEFFARCGLGYYGCCEPLDNKLDILRKIPNLRKIGVSPWADINTCAEQIAGDYVFARKPNPAHVAVKTDSDVIRKEIKDTMDACQKHGCVCEFVLKDISTVSRRPENLVIWERTVTETLDSYF